MPWSFVQIEIRSSGKKGRRSLGVMRRCAAARNPQCGRRKRIGNQGQRQEENRNRIGIIKNMRRGFDDITKTAMTVVVALMTVAAMVAVLAVMHIRSHFEFDRVHACVLRHHALERKEQQQAKHLYRLGKDHVFILRGMMRKARAI